MNTNHLQSTSLLAIRLSTKGVGSSKFNLTTKGYIHEDGYLAAHRKIHPLKKRPVNKQWKVTHLITGSSIGILVSSKEKAISCMITLTQNFDWSFKDIKNLSDHKKKQMRELIKDLNNKYK
tara:strand:+ start:2432 stop:2794 length:363 start_codon:yes stop_codon:yes gene_type:complete